MKTYRPILPVETMRNADAQLPEPPRVTVLRHANRTVDPAVPAGAMILVLAMVGSVAVFSVAPRACGPDFDTALSGAVLALSNVGRGLGDVMGPVGSFAPLCPTLPG